jgi:hypothetical protein
MRAKGYSLTAIAYYYTGGKEPKENDWCTVSKLLGFLKSTINDELKIEAKDCGNITWCFHTAL